MYRLNLDMDRIARQRQFLGYNDKPVQLLKEPDPEEGKARLKTAFVEAMRDKLETKERAEALADEAVRGR